MQDQMALGEGIIKIQARYYGRLLFIFTLLMLIPACVGNEILTTVAFFISCICLVIFARDLEILAYYFIIILINSSLAGMSLTSNSEYTITPIIYSYFILLFFWNLLYTSNSKKMLVPKIFYVCLFLYRIINSILNEVNTITVVWESMPILIGALMQLQVLHKKKSGYLLVVSLVVSIVVICMTGYIELFIGKTFFYSLWKGYTYRYGIMRVGSTLADPNFMTLIDLSMFFILGCTPVSKLYKVNTINFLRAIIAIQIILAFSRTGIIALIAFIVVILVSKKKWLIIFMVPLILLTATVLLTFLDYFFFSFETGSTGTRLRIINTALSLWSEQKLIGLGRNAFLSASQNLIGMTSDTTNTYVQLLVEYGIIGVTFYIANILLVLRKSVTSLFRGNKSQLFHTNLYFFVAVCSWMFMSYSLDSYSKILYWLFPAIYIAITQMEEDLE